MPCCPEVRSSCGRRPCCTAPASLLEGLIELGDEAYAAAVDELLDAEDQARGGAPDTAARLEEARRRLTAAVQAAETRQQALLAAVAGRPDFREAVLWQNPAIVEPMVVALAETPVGHRPNQRLRRKQRIVARYWARYCAKTTPSASSARPAGRRSPRMARRSRRGPVPA